MLNKACCDEGSPWTMDPSRVNHNLARFLKQNGVGLKVILSMYALDNSHLEGALETTNLKK